MQRQNLARGQLLAGRYEVITVRDQAVLWTSYSGYVRSGPPPDGESGAPDPYVLLKVVHPELLAEPGACEQLVQAMQRVKELRSPGLRRLLDVQHCAALQTVLLVEHGQTGRVWSPLHRSDTRSQDENFSLAAVRTDCERLVAVLSGLHSQQLRHGDLRFESVMEGQRGLRLCDVGLGASLPRPRYLRALREAGQLELIAPEVRAGQPPDARSDLYGLAALCKAVLSLGSPRGWATIAAESPALHRVIERSLAGDPGQRHDSVAALLFDLATVAERGPSPSVATVSMSRIGHLPESNSLIMALGPMGSAPIEPARSTPDLVDGWIGADAPVELGVEGTDLVRAVAVRDLLQQQLVDEALPRDNREVGAARLAATVRMELVPARAGDFTIEALSPPEQPVHTDELTIWEWLITAHAPLGDKLLRLKVSNLLDEQGRPLGKSLPSRELVIRVVIVQRLERLLFTADGLRRLLDALLPREPELDALIENHFPRVQARLQSGMERAAKVGLLLAHTPSRALLDALQDERPESFAAKAPALALAPFPSAVPQAGTGASGPSQERPDPAASPPPSTRARLLRWLGPVVAAGLTALVLNLARTPSPPPADRPGDGPVTTRALTPLTDRTQAADAVPLGTSYAVLFATTRYDDPRWPPLVTPAPDADEIAADLRSLYGFSVERVSNPSVSELRAKIRSLAERRYAQGDQLLLLFSGHGDKDDVLRKGWVIARDSRADERQTAYPYSELREDIDSIPCRHILLILDVCFGGLFDPSIREAQVRGAEYQEASVQEFIGRKLRYRSRLYVSSVDQRTEAPEGRGHSPFAWRLLEALRSGGGSDGVLTWNELVSHLEKLDPEPRGGVFPRTMNSDPGGDFLFVSVARARPPR
ncbi:MAG: caspase family protein [Polyangia bacterium]